MVGFFAAQRRLCLTAACLCICLYFAPPVLALLWAAETVFHAVAVLVFAGALIAFWCFGVGALVNAIFGHRSVASDSTHLALVADGGRRAINGGAMSGAGVRVALVYPTRNDVREEAVEALRRVRALQGRRCEVVVCDDSTLAEWRERVDALVALSEPGGGRGGPRGNDDPSWNRVRLIRRPAGSPGWKAGNVNHALRQLESEGFTHFAVCDADGVFPEDFVERTLWHFDDELHVSGSAVASRAEDRGPVAYVQTRQEGDCSASTRFSRLMAPAVGAHFRQQVAGRAAGGGFVMFYGHGALMSMEAWRAVGGFPEIVTEDLAFSMKLRAAGWRGVYADEVVCREEFPLSWPQLRKRTDKWIRGTGECLKLNGKAFFRSARVPWAEKLDVLMHGSQHFLAVPMLVFLGLLATVLPWSMKEFRMPGSFFVPPVVQGKSMVEAVMGLRYHVFWSWDFYLMMTVSMLAPVLCFGIERLGRRGGTVPFRWRELPGFFLASTFTYLAGLVTESLSALVFCLTGRATFRVTNDAAEEEGAKNAGGSATLSWADGFNPNHWSVYILEVAVGLVFLVAVGMHRNLWFLGPGVALVLSPLVASRRFGGWERWWVRGLAAVPGLCLLLLLLLIGYQLARR